MSPGVRGTLLITLAIQALASAAALTVPVLAPVLVPVFGVPGESVGAYVSSIYIGAMLGSLASGGCIGRYGAIRVSQWCLLLCAIGLTLALLASPVIALVGAVLTGLGYGPITPASSHLLARTTPPQRMGFVFSLKQTGVPLGGVIAGMAAPRLNDAWGWQSAILAIATSCLLCAALAQMLRGALDADRGRSVVSGFASLRQSLGMIWTHPSMRLLSLSSLTFSAVQLSLNAYLVVYLHDSLGYSLIVAGAMMSVSQVAGVLGRLVWGWCADKFMGAVAMLAVLAFTMAACGWGLASLGPGVPQIALLLLLVVFGAGALGWNGVYLAEVARQAPAGQIGLATGGALAATYFGVVIGPTAFGSLATMMDSYRAAFAIIVIPAFVLGLILLKCRSGFRPIEEVPDVQSSKHAVCAGRPT